MAQQQLPFSVDQLLANEMPKMFRIADDMHAMASYMNDLRIIAILGTVLGIVGGIGFLISKYCQKSKSDGYDVCPQDDMGTGRGRHARPVHPSAFAPVHQQWHDRGQMTDIESKLAIRLPEHADASGIRNGDRKHHANGRGDVANV